MTRSRIALITFAALLIFSSFWLWWNRPHRVDMTAYAPADALCYIEANDLPQIATALTTNSSARALFAAGSLDLDTQHLDSWATFVARTGIGSAEAVVLARAQVGIVLLGFEDAGATGSALPVMNPVIKPRIAVIVEAHTSEMRVRKAVSKLVGDFAQQAYGSPQLATREDGDVYWQTWTSQSESRQIVAATTETVAIIGNDVRAVEACLAVRRGEQQSLEGDGDLAEMRRRTDAGEALSFGYISPANAAKLAEITATVYAAQFDLTPQIQSTAATLLPQLLPRLVGSAAWSAHANNGGIEDRYVFQIPASLAARLRTPFAATDAFDSSFATLLPADTKQLSVYLFRDTEAAWRGAQAALASQLDTINAALLVVFGDKSLAPYGIDSPRDFFRHTAPPIATARLDLEGQSTVLVARVRDEGALNISLRKRFGIRTERIGSHEMLIQTTNEVSEAAIILDGYLVMGSADGVRRCITARDEGHSLGATNAFKSALTSINGYSLAERPSIFNFEEQHATQRASVRALASLMGESKMRSKRSIDLEAFARALDDNTYSLGETRINENAFERRTHSVFGLYGMLLAGFGEANTENAQ